MLLYILSTFTSSEVLWHVASSSCIMFVQYIRGGVFTTLGGVQYIGKIPWVHQGISCMHWRVFSTSRENHEYIGGNHEYIGGLSSTSAGYHDTCGKQGDKAFQFILKTLMYWTSVDVLMISSDVLMVSPWCTVHPPPPPPHVLNTHYTDLGWNEINGHCLSNNVSGVKLNHLNHTKGHVKLI